MAKRPCARPLCGALVDRGYCEKHAASAPQRRTEAARGSSSARGYGYRWQKYRKQYLREHPLCVGWPKGKHADECSLAGEHVDHIVPVKNADDPLFWDASNHQPLSAACHSSKTATEDGGFGRRRWG